MIPRLINNNSKNSVELSILDFYIRVLSNIIIYRSSAAVFNIECSL